MKILQVMAGNDHGGAETAFVDMCIAMHEAGMEIEVATRANPVRVPALEAAGIKVHTLPFGGPIDVFTGWKLGRIIKQIRRDKIPAVFVESISDSRLLERIRQESGAKIGGTLYSDALSKDDGPVVTYLDMMRHNANTLVEALKE